MPRPLVIGNGTLLVNFDEKLSIRDFYFPYVGLFNHLSGHKIRMAVWVEGSFAWLDDDGWRRSLAYEPNTLVTKVEAEHESLGVALRIRDAVHARENAYLKEVWIDNKADRDREVRLFFTHDFIIAENDIGDTAFYYPYADAVVHYKRRHYFLITGFTPTEGIYEYANGIKGFQDFEGTWRDAEDGSLSMNPIAQGSVDSTISFRLQVPAGGSMPLRYCIVADTSLESVTGTYSQVAEAGIDEGINQTSRYWQSWSAKTLHGLETLPDDVVALYRRSLLTIRTQVDNGGAVTAANDSDIMLTARAHYSYMWPRDGGLVAYALDRLGYTDITRKFFQFCKRILPPERPALMHKYTADGAMGASWHPWVVDGKPEIPFQEDGTALVLWALRHHYDQNQDLEFLDELYTDFVIPIADFLVSHRDPNTKLPLPSWDLWEERRGVHTFTAACVWAGLISAQRLARVFHDGREERYGAAAHELREAMLHELWNEEHNRFIRCLHIAADGTATPDITIDSSLFSVPLLGVLPPHAPQVLSTVQQVREALWVKSEVGGMARYENDYYFRSCDGYAGNPWFICTMWLAEYQIIAAQTVADLDEPLELLRWAARHALPTGILSEQVHPVTGAPLSVAPLTWSHAEYVTAVADWLDKHDRLSKA